MIVKTSEKGLLKINLEVLKTMTSFRQDNIGKTEAGGVFLGRFILNSNNLVVDKVTIPMADDKRSRYAFIRSEKMHQKIITATWEKSNGTCNYLGEWHTHPESYPTPSKQDIFNWKNILTTGIFSSLYLYFIIIGIKEVRIWDGNRLTKKINRLK